MQEHWGDAHQGVIPAHWGKAEISGAAQRRSEVTATQTLRETLSHDRISALLWLQNERGGEPGKSLEKVTWGPRGGRGRVLFVWAARVPTLTFPINEPLEGLHIGNAKHRKEAGKKRVRWKRKVVCRGTEGVIPSGLVTFLALSAGSISNTH